MTIKSPVASIFTSNGIECSWEISTTTEQIFRLQFLDFQTEDSTGCKSSFIQVFDGPNTQSNKLGKKLCGNTLPDDKHINGKDLFVQFLTTNPNAALNAFRIKLIIKGRNI